VAGIAHAGIGLDICFQQKELDDTPPGAFDPAHWWPAAAGYDAARPPTFTPPGVWRELRAALGRAGMSESEAQMVMGGNMMRVARQVWQA